jgi:VWFA-related protein
MKTLSAFAFVLYLLCAGPRAYPHPQDLRHATGTVNVEVPVRVFDGDRFVDGLTLQDFEVFEDGRPQKIAAVYLVRKTDIERKETSNPQAAAPEPRRGRTFVLQFQLAEPSPKLDEALDYFLDQVLGPEDALTVVTPLKTYALDPEAVARRPRPDVARELKSRIRKDLVAEGAELRRLAGDLRDVEAGPMGPDEKLARMSEIQRQIRDRVSIDPRSLRRLAETLKAREGRKFVFIFYGRESVRTSSFGAFGDESLASAGGHLGDMAATEARRTPTVGPAELERAFSDASVTVHFIYLTRPGRNAAGLGVEDQMGEDPAIKYGTAQPDPKGGAADISAGFFAAFREMAEATGGVTTSSANALAGLRSAAAATENYYLLYYAPDDYRADGRFRAIEVRVKGPGLRVTHRAGYFAD